MNEPIFYLLALSFFLIYLMIGVGVKNLSLGRIYERSGEQLPSSHIVYFLVVIFWPLFLILASMTEGE